MTYYGAVSTPSSAAGSCPFNEWAEQHRAETQPPKLSSLDRHRPDCPRYVTYLDTLDSGEVWCRHCRRVLGIDWCAVHDEHTARRAS